MPPDPPKKNSGPIVAVAIVAVLVLLGGGGAIVWALSGDDSAKKPSPIAESRAPTTALTAPPTDSPTDPTAFPIPTDPTSPSPTLDESSFVQAGDCVRITGTAPDLQMLRTSCGSAPYKVLKRFSGTSDQTKCRSVSGYTTAFYARNKTYSFRSYVLCLKHQ
jgi:hypothetical protein